MKITVAKSAGFCFGVKNAVETAYNYAKDNVCILGELIHNPIVIEKLDNLGVKCVKNIEDIKTNKVIIRSHGAPKNVFDYLEKNGIEIIDATCPFVKKIHKIVDENYRLGKQIVILGEANHSEVIGINGWCDNTAIIFNSTNDIPKFDADKEYCLVAQTTFSITKYKEIIKNIAKQGAKTVEFFNTICYTTKERQDEARLLAKTSDAVLVLGGKKSSNTLKLYDICKEYCSSVYLIEKIADLKSVKINKNKLQSLAILAGASTPTELIEEVTNTMGQTENLDKVQEVAVETAEEQVEKKESMKDLFDSTSAGKPVRYFAGKRLKAKVISANETGVFCSIGGKKDGFIAKEDASLDAYNPEDFQKDALIDVVIIENKSKDSEYIALSKKEIDSIIEGDKKAAEILSGNEFSLVCDKVAKNKADKAVGLIGKLGSYTIFVPASQIRSGFVKNLDEYVGKTLRLRALPEKDVAEGEDVKHTSSKRIVASQRVILEEEKTAREEAFWAEMQVGAIVLGKVKRFTEFGAFISVKGFDCLARKSELAWTRIEKPEDVLALNEKYEFIILDVDREKGRISLGFKQLQKTPYEIAAEQLTVGDVIKGKVVRIAPFGAFVEIIPGVDGLVHISQITHDYIKTLDDVLKVGDEVEAKITKIDDKKITLSIKDLLPEPEVVEKVEDAEGEQVEKPVRKPRAKKEDGEKKEIVRKPRAKKEDDGEPHEWVDQGAATTTLGDLFAGIKFDFNDENK